MAQYFVLIYTKLTFKGGESKVGLSLEDFTFLIFVLLHKNLYMIKHLPGSIASLSAMC